MSIFFFYARLRSVCYDTKKVKALLEDKLGYSNFCFTSSRILFDRYLERDGRYEYLEAGSSPNFIKKRASIENDLFDERIDNSTNSNSKRKYFFAMNLFNNEEAIPYIRHELMLLFKFFGHENVYLSIYENGSKDNSKALLRDFSKVLELFDIKHKIVLENDPRPKEFHRIQYLAKVRNLALVPLEEQRRNGQVYDKIIFLNDILFCRNDILELVYQSDFQGSDLTCSLDFFSDLEKDPPLLFRDTWVARDIKGSRFNQSLEELSDHPESRQRNDQKLPFQVQCSWNGAAILNPKPFYDENPLRFRRSQVGTSECSASECSLLCNDLWNRGFRRFVVVPEIMVSYRLKDAVFADYNYDKLLNITRTLDEKIQYIDGPEKIFCIGLDGMSIIEPDQPDRWVNYTNTGTKVI
ncbi:Alpha-1,3-mannosyltransferase CMT1 [Smittium mucronatum]|uniref:Alpha-1,3-mannosyltransferase CMT1 n=1 Tax=Smittium mucronatum TaxID=133383 RepID=A0A1R0GNF4_9FUNG|nr:Alpha-1,3-mannosyltransferase CMT1 [Smittium mucronatum]